MAKRLLQQYSDFEDKVHNKIKALVRQQGVESKFSNEKVLKVKDEQQFTLTASHYVTEISEKELIDHRGYTYSYDMLSVAQLCEIYDSLT